MLRPRQHTKLARGAEDEEHAMSPKLNSGIAVIGIDIGKNSFHVVGLDRRGAGAIPPLPAKTRLTPLLFLLSRALAMSATH